MLTVSLSGVRFQAPIGLYPQEAFLGNEIELFLSVSQQAAIDNLPLIDYALLHAIAEAAVQEPAHLLETVLQRIVAGVTGAYPGSRIKVAVRKRNPPMAGQIDYSEVQWES
ncbi:dihydroneopterin aldolase [Taibaiella koreensis]|uniref:dihydroneopterin aldolase n=1 Tax=Taibaiella koreensis TaxID=1268548 RepID=UPI000E59D7B4|nr:dihydroneopterin aldolase [Taibaiella koreensis]